MARREEVYVRKRTDVYVGKKQLDQEAGLTAHIGTEWETIMASRKDYRPSQLPDEGWDFSQPDHVERLMAGRPLFSTKKYPLNKELADRAIRAFGKLRLSDVVDTPALDEVGERWFRDIVRLVFGCYDPVRKLRMIRELFLLVPKKNSKTTYGALLMLLIMIFNERPRGQAIMVAPERKVAGIAFDALAGAISLDPVLKKRFMVKEHKKQVVDRWNRAELSVVTFDPKAVTGGKYFAALVDELHVMSTMANAAKSIRQIRGGMLPFKEAILIFITTQSEEAPAGVFKAELQAARDVRDGKRPGSKLFPILYEFPLAVQQSPDKDWKNPKLWRLVTPNADRSIAIDDLVTMFNEAESKGEAELKSWASQHLNVEIGVALRSDSWTGAVLWEKRKYEKISSLQDLLTLCEVATVGIDGGGLDDLLGLSVVGRERETGKWLAWCKAWVSDTVLELRKSEAQRFLDLKAAGDLTIVPAAEMGTDIDELVQIVMSVEKAGLLDKVGLDPYGVGVIVDALLSEGLEPDRIVGISQGWRLGGAIKTTERALAEGKLLHCGQPMMNYCVGNAKVEPRGNAILITKQASGTAKIDPLMAMFNAVHLISQNPASKSKKYQILVFGGKKQAA